MRQEQEKDLRESEDTYSGSFNIKTSPSNVLDSIEEGRSSEKNMSFKRVPTQKENLTPSGSMIERATETKRESIFEAIKIGILGIKKEASGDPPADKFRNSMRNGSEIDEGRTSRKSKKLTASLIGNNKLSGLEKLAKDNSKYRQNIA